MVKLDSNFNKNTNKVEATEGQLSLSTYNKTLNDLKFNIEDNMEIGIFKQAVINNIRIDEITSGSFIKTDEDYVNRYTTSKGNHNLIKSSTNLSYYEQSLIISNDILVHEKDLDGSGIRLMGDITKKYESYDDPYDSDDDTFSGVSINLSSNSLYVETKAENNSGDFDGDFEIPMLNNLSERTITFNGTCYKTDSSRDRNKIIIRLENIDILDFDTNTRNENTYYTIHMKIVKVDNGYEIFKDGSSLGICTTNRNYLVMNVDMYSYSRLDNNVSQKLTISPLNIANPVKPKNAYMLYNNNMISEYDYYEDNRGYKGVNIGVGYGNNGANLIVSPSASQEGNYTKAISASKTVDYFVPFENNQVRVIYLKNEISMRNNSGTRTKSTTLSVNGWGILNNTLSAYAGSYTNNLYRYVKCIRKNKNIFIYDLEENLLKIVEDVKLKFTLSALNFEDYDSPTSSKDRYEKAKLYVNPYFLDTFSNGEIITKGVLKKDKNKHIILGVFGKTDNEVNINTLLKCEKINEVTEIKNLSYHSEDGVANDFEENEIQIIKEDDYIYTAEFNVENDGNYLNKTISFEFDRKEQFNRVELIFRNTNGIKNFKIPKELKIFEAEDYLISETTYDGTTFSNEDFKIGNENEFTLKVETENIKCITGFNGIVDESDNLIAISAEGVSWDDAKKELTTTSTNGLDLAIAQTNNFSFILDLKITSKGAVNQVIINSGTQHLLKWDNVSSKIGFKLGSTFVETLEDFVLSEYCRIIGTYNGSVYTLYKDGVKIYSETQTISPISNLNLFKEVSQNNGFIGKSKKIIILNRALIEEEIILFDKLDEIPDITKEIIIKDTTVTYDTGIFYSQLIKIEMKAEKITPTTKGIYLKEVIVEKMTTKPLEEINMDLGEYKMNDVIIRNIENIENGRELSLVHKINPNKSKYVKIISEGAILK